ncbi:hypothetical protein HMPREF9948_0918 [Propionibacterium sp. 434-HC2]|nr:hypothetical protein HMPREF9948_0918 [Propionibacterium sp. 434-HC2]
MLVNWPHTQRMNGRKPSPLFPDGEAVVTFESVTESPIRSPPRT